MSWRLATVITAALVVFDAAWAPLSYSTPTWDWGHTKILYGWEAVYEINLIWFPWFALALIVVCGTVITGLMWALGDDL